MNDMNIDELLKTIYKHLNATINSLHQIKSDDDLHKLMRTITIAAGDALVKEKDSLKAIEYIAVLKVYFEKLGECKSNDATIIAFAMAEVLESAEKDSRKLAKVLHMLANKHKKRTTTS